MHYTFFLKFENYVCKHLLDCMKIDVEWEKGIIRLRLQLVKWIKKRAHRKRKVCYLQQLGEGKL